MDVNVTAECWDIEESLRDHLIHIHGGARGVHVLGDITEAPRFSDDKQDVWLGIKSVFRPRNRFIWFDSGDTPNV